MGGGGGSWVPGTRPGLLENQRHHTGPPCLRRQLVPDFTPLLSPRT